MAKRALADKEYEAIQDRWLRARMKQLPAAEYVGFLNEDLAKLKDERVRYRAIINLLCVAIEYDANDKDEVLAEAKAVLAGTA